MRSVIARRLVTRGGSGVTAVTAGGSGVTALNGQAANKMFLSPLVTNLKKTDVQYSTAPSSTTMYSKDEKREFMAVFPDLNRDLSFLLMPKDLGPLVSKHVTKCIQYTVPDGKKNRGYSVPSSFRLLAKEQQITDENIRLANILGWTVEFLQAFFLVADDIMDHSQTRRGKPCWYKLDNVGLTAFNDSIILETCVYSILKKYFKHQPYYMDLVELLHETTTHTALGQALDLSSAETFNKKKGQTDCMDHFTLDRYKAIVKYKTSYYSFYLPVALAMRMTGIQDENLYKMARHILLDMGHFFQAQDDYLDCFGDPEVTGKQGTDIQDGKCTWLLTVALQRASPDNKEELIKRYGNDNPEDVAWVKNLYTDLGLPWVFQKYEEDFYGDICEQIQRIPGDELPQEVFNRFLRRIYKRSK